MSGHRTWWMGTLAVVLLAAVAAQATSHIRIVRLSYVDGNVKMDRAAGQGLERAILNAPVVEGSRIVTGRDGLAEIEFENNSVVRLGEATEVVFSQLLINDAGDKVNEVSLVRGTMYFDTRSSKIEINRVLAADRTFILRRNSQVRFMMSGDQVQSAVFSGEARLDNNSELVNIKKNETLTVDATAPAGFLVAKGVDSVAFDRWSNERHAYQDVYAYNNYGYGGKGLSTYGFQDLAYYGTFMDIPGYGYAWQPFGASSWMGWNPYMSGTWAYTQGAGYVWASAYPWGWLPYHYGSWGYMPSYGWFWAPGNSLANGGVLTNWQGTAPVVNGPGGYTAPVPPALPTAGPRPTIMVGRIGNSPAFLPDGPTPPNFRSVITDHSGLAGMNAPSSFTARGAGYAGATHNSRAVTTARAEAVRGGHVFATPPPSMMPGWMHGGDAPMAARGVGRSAAPMRSSVGMGRAAGAGSGGVHASGSSNPK